MKYLYSDTVTVLIFAPAHHWSAYALWDKLFMHSRRSNLQVLSAKVPVSYLCANSCTKGKEGYTLCLMWGITKEVRNQQELSTCTDCSAVRQWTAETMHQLIPDRKRHTTYRAVTKLSTDEVELLVIMLVGTGRKTKRSWHANLSKF